jgi:superfamily II DNA/RNA helicase
MIHWPKRRGQQEPKQVWQVLHRLKQTMPDSWLPQVACLTTPFAATTALQRSGLSPAMNEFITAYEPQAAKQGIFVHQQQVLQASLQHPQHILLTSSTGSGKSLCFWAWIVHKLAQDPQATALVCFPTQALLWGQSMRLQEISQHCVISRQGLAYSGQFVIAGQIVPWTVWKGSGNSDQAMALHENSYNFKQARLRIATIDKVHYSLLRGDVHFAARLSCMVLDEAHQYQGVFGAQTAYLLKRLSAFKIALGKLPPQVFLASATLPQAREFAAKLLSVNPDEIIQQTDAIQTRVELVDWAEAEDLLAHPPQSALLRAALFYDKQPARSALTHLLGDSRFGRCNVVYFSPSKHASRLLKQSLLGRGSKPHVVIYDADLPLPERRALEQEFRSIPQAPIVLLATTALELGVDIEGLDVCFIPDIPASCAGFLQCIGRVGRRQGQPGLIVVNLSTSLRDEQYRRNLADLFRLPEEQKFFLPLQLEWVNLKSLAALAAEFQQARTKIPRLSVAACQQAIRFVYGECPSTNDVRRRLTGVCGMIDFTQNYWQYAGFRGGKGQDKVPLIDQVTDQTIALLDRTAVLRDAHMGANYLDHNNRNWKVSAYGNKVEAALRFQNNCGINADQIQRIYVEPAATGIITRGICRNEAKLISALDTRCQVPRNLVYGQWRVRQQVAAYRQVRTAKRQVTIEKIPPNEVLIKEIVTLGWVWRLPVVLTNQAELCLREMTGFFQLLFTELVVQTAGVASQDLLVDFSARRSELQVMDAEQGGNGIAAYLLQAGTAQALRNCHQVLIDYQKFRNSKSNLVAQTVAQINNLDQAIAIMQELCRHWAFNLQRATVN